MGENSIETYSYGQISPPNGIPDQEDNFGPETLIHPLSPGRLIIKRMQARNIRRKGFKFASDQTLLFNPSLKFTLGPLSSEPLVHSTRTLLDTDENPSFGDDTLSFDIQDPNTITREKDISLKIEILNKNLLHFDTLGEIEVSVVRFLSAKQPQKEEFTVKIVGETSIQIASLALEFHFYPTTCITKEDTHSEKCTPLAQEVVDKSKQHAANSCQIFSEKDIEDSFKFFDLDKNGFIGASELRHALICMGELVTDEEIDTMINILDLNGDGQANFNQFRMMGKSPNFAFINNHNLPMKEKESKSSDLDYNVMRNVLSGFVLNNKISRHTINDFREFLGQKRNAKLSAVDVSDTNVEIFHIDCSSLCRYLDVHRTGESETVFDLVKVLVDDNEYADARSLILSLVNFIPTFSVFERCQIMLELYDNQKLGHLSYEDLKRVLAANHMRSVNEVDKKSQTIMKFVDSKNTGNLRHEDLLDAATKFPNLLFPRHVGEGSL